GAANQIFRRFVQQDQEPAVGLLEDLQQDLHNLGQEPVEFERIAEPIGDLQKQLELLGGLGEIEAAVVIERGVDAGAGIGIGRDVVKGEQEVADLDKVAVLERHAARKGDGRIID